MAELALPRVRVRRKKRKPPTTTWKLAATTVMLGGAVVVWKILDWDDVRSPLTIVAEVCFIQSCWRQFLKPYEHVGAQFEWTIMGWAVLLAQSVIELLF